MNKILSLLAALRLVGCAVVEPTKLTHSPTFEPVFPHEKDTSRVPTGGIYVSRESDSWFGRGRNFQVGDVITVLLNETTQASRTQGSDISRSSTNDVITPALQSKTAARLPSPFGGALGALKLDGSTVTSKGTGTAGQNASLTGSVAVSVVSIMANGNLVLRGEKQLALTEGAETIQVAGIIRPEDVSAVNTVQSRRLANAQISYRGSGDLASTAKAGWGTSALMKLWPF
jgi:flagellar L-ring protein precursor FlgH